MTHRLRAGLATLVCWALSGGAAHGLGSKDFVGNYAFSGGSTETSARSAALKEAIASLNPLFRVVARPFLDSVTKIPKTVRIVLQGQALGVQIEPYPLRVSALDGTPSKFKGTIGQDSVMTRHWEGATIVEAIKSASGSRGNVYRMADDGRSLVVQTSFQSSQLQQPLRYTLTYRRL